MADPRVLHWLITISATLLLVLLQGHTEIIWAIEVSGNRVYTASADKTVRVWDLNTKRCMQVGALWGLGAGSLVFGRCCQVPLAGCCMLQVGCLAGG